MNAPRPRVLLADDHATFAETLRDFLSPHFDIVGMAQDGHALLAAAAELEPDVAVVDIGMPLLNGLEAGRQLKERQPDLRLMYLTQNREPALAVKAFRIGASAFLIKSFAASELVAAIHEVQCGRAFVSPVIWKNLVRCLLLDEPDLHENQMTAHRDHILQMLTEGKSMNELAATVRISSRALQLHEL